MRAGKDLKCPEARIAIAPLLGGRYKATGCGREAIYHSACAGLECSVGREGEDAPAWRDRPDPGSPEDLRY
jgi:hypothetical protein